MRDFNVGNNLNVGGDLHINDNSNQSKHLINCSNNELFEERKYRKKILSNERKSKWKRVAVAWIFVAFIIGIVAIWLYIQGNVNLSNLVLSLGGLLITITSIKTIEQPTEFELRQMSALNEIHLILRERGVER